jgi:hypothetical protein
LNHEGEKGEHHKIGLGDIAAGAHSFKDSEIPLDDQRHRKKKKP